MSKRPDGAREQYTDTERTPVRADGGVVSEPQGPDGEEGDLPDVVVTFGGSGGGLFHQPMPCDEPRAACGTHGRNPLFKRRELIESHYRPCLTCFPRTRRDE